MRELAVDINLYGDPEIYIINFKGAPPQIRPVLKSLRLLFENVLQTMHDQGNLEESCAHIDEIFIQTVEYLISRRY
jgi:hypothetical protein